MNRTSENVTFKRRRESSVNIYDVTGTCGKTCVEQRPKMCGPKKCRKRQVVVAENKIGTKYLEFEALLKFCCQL